MALHLEIVLEPPREICRGPQAAAVGLVTRIVSASSDTFPKPTKKWPATRLIPNHLLIIPSRELSQA